jgi:predicted branched-subunit amino acid permease
VSSRPNGFALGARLGLPIAISFFMFGLAFGVAAASRGISPLMSGVASGLVFSGSSQFMILDLLGRPGTALTILASVFLLNIRHVVMGATLLTSSSDKPYWLRLCGLLMMIDETWAVAMAPQAAGDRLGVIVGCGVVAMFGWVAGTVFGGLIGGAIGNVEQFGIAFIYFAVFIFILVSMAASKPAFIPWAIAAIVAWGVQLVLPGKWHVIIGGVAGALVGGYLSWNKAQSS